MEAELIEALKLAAEEGAHSMGCSFHLSIVHINNVRGNKKREVARIKALAEAEPCDCWLSKVNRALAKAGK